MREDMKTVVTERPRSGGGVKTPKGYKRRENRCDIEDAPKREKMQQKWDRMTGEKQFTDVLGPIFGYLLKNVGKPWDKVYSEISKNLPKKTLQNIHIWTHIWQFVERDVIMIDNVPCHKDNGIYGIPLSQMNYGGRVQLYIHPVNGLLCKAKGKRKEKHKEPREPGIKFYHLCQLHKINGVWHEVKLRKLNDYEGMGMFGFSLQDAILGEYYNNKEEIRRVYGGLYIAESSRQLTAKEIKRNCLS